MPTGYAVRRPVGAILLVVGPRESRILILRIVRKATVIAMRSHRVESVHNFGGRLMNRMWSSILTAVAVTSLVALSVVAASPDADESPVAGEMVDTDVPATYRLPAVTPIVESEAIVDAAPVAKAAPSEGPMFAAPMDMPGLATADANIANTQDTTLVDIAPTDISVVDDRPVNDDVTPVPGDDEGIGSESVARRGAFASQLNGNANAAMIHVGMEGAAPIVTDERIETWVAQASFTPTTTELTSQLLPAVQRGFGLAQKGAYFAARTEFVQVLRRIALAHDAAADTDEHAKALAAGLRALDEAEDFVPNGVQLEAELDVRSVASSHRTDVLPDEFEKVTPREAVSLYHVFAQEQLKVAVAGEQAGSMVLYGLGTIYTKLAQRCEDDMQMTQCAMTMYSAALGTCPNNYMAANELGVLVCRSGRAEQAIGLFQQTIDFAPSAVAYHNLAIALQKIGQCDAAAANEVESQRLAALERSRGEVSRRAGIQWVTPAEMARAGRSEIGAPAAADQVQPIAPEPAKSTWRKMVDSTKSLPFPGKGPGNENLGPVPAERVAQPMSVNQSQWR